jgi:hypothetical protein
VVNVVDNCGVLLELIEHELSKREHKESNTFRTRWTLTVGGHNRCIELTGR